MGSAASMSDSKSKAPENSSCAGSAVKSFLPWSGETRTPMSSPSTPPALFPSSPSSSTISMETPVSATTSSPLPFSSSGFTAVAATAVAATAVAATADAAAAATTWTGTCSACSFSLISSFFSSFSLSFSSSASPFATTLATSTATGVGWGGGPLSSLAFSSFLSSSSSCSCSSSSGTVVPFWTKAAEMDWGATRTDFIFSISSLIWSESRFPDLAFDRVSFAALTRSLNTVSSSFSNIFSRSTVLRFSSRLRSSSSACVELLRLTDMFCFLTEDILTFCFEPVNSFSSFRISLPRVCISSCLWFSFISFSCKSSLALVFALTCSWISPRSSSTFAMSSWICCASCLVSLSSCSSASVASSLFSRNSFVIDSALACSASSSLAFFS
mmetsp:Transcript_23222/g.45281  ORF Transcript_23222/g.45281 Transcript_23222/m.45281 type:complete len:386 (+) Transcript_23222:3604-4761(+)